MNLLKLHLSLILTMTMLMSAHAQDLSGFLYAKVLTVTDQTYEGPVRWGNEEVYWFDHFNAEKTKNEYLDYLDKNDLEGLKEDQEGWWESWVEKFDESQSFKHQFVCRFGDIESIKIITDDKVRLSLKNGKNIAVVNASNDFDTEVQVLDNDLGFVRIDWDKIESVEFMDAPATLEASFGKPLYGKVWAGNSTFEGFIQWDHDERVSTDKLDGYNGDADVAIAMGKIKALAKSANGVEVVLFSGREFRLTGTNDVGSGNRGIIVNMPGKGRVDIDWNDFRKLELTEDYEHSGPSYSDYPPAKALAGSVLTIKDDSYTGAIVFDLDEGLDIEILQGQNEGIEYLIPFRDISAIQPKNYKYSLITWRGGEQILLGQGQDVSASNQGVLVFIDDNNTQYIPYEDIQEIVFK